MVDKFLCIVGDLADGRHAAVGMVRAFARRSRMTAVLNDDRCVSYAGSDAGIVTLDNGRGVVVGTLFEGLGPSPRKTSLDRNEQDTILRSAGSKLTEAYWGGYVAILAPRPDEPVVIVRDPSGAQPCYYARLGGLTVVASHVDMLVACGLGHLSINWSYIATQLVLTDLRTPETGIAGVQELLPGFSLQVGQRDILLRQLWSPWTFAEAKLSITDPVEAARLIRETTIGCVGGWASVFKHIVLGVSGGLDSSIVAASLADVGAKFSCLTLVANNPTGDERAYAQLLCDSVGAPLREVFEDPSLIDIARSDASHLPRPLARSFAQSGDHANLELARDVGADAFFSGAGGDNVFCYLQSVTPIADRLLDHGLGPGAFETIDAICQLAGCSAWRAGTGAVRRAWFTPPAYRWRPDYSLLGPSAGQWVDRDCSHPWLDTPRGARPGKAAHIALLLHIQNHLEGFKRERTHPVISPLMAQPLVELALRIPTWMWCGQGYNRLVARNAFAKDLLPSIAYRRSKGTPDSFVVQIYEAHRAEALEMLANGQLAERGIIDVDAVRAVLTDPAPARGVDYWRIMAFVDVEAWIRIWSRRATASHESEVVALSA